MPDLLRMEVRGHREHAVVTIVGSLEGAAAHTLRRTLGLPRVLRHAFSSSRRLAEMQALEQVEERLLDKFPLATRETVHRVVSACHHEFEGRPVRDFIAVLVENDAADRLRLLDVRSAEGLDGPWYDDDWPHVLS